MRYMTFLRAAMVVLLSLTWCGGLRAQITEVGTSPELLTVVRSLPTAGVKLYSTSPDGVTLWNLDLSVFLSIAHPPLPSGYSYFSVLYITENTFDNDPLSIELMMLTINASGVTGTRVIRDDGTIVFEDLGYSISGGGGYDDVNDRPPLFTDENGTTFMSLTTYPSNPPTSSKLFQLPGTLPCYDCTTGSWSGIRDQDMEVKEGDLTLYPNPAADHLTVDVLLPPGNTAGRLMVQDALGRLVASLPVSGSGKVVVPLAGYQSGSYTCVLLTDGHVRRAKRFVVDR